MDLVYRGYKEPESKYVLWIKGDELYLYSRGVWKLVNNVVHINVDDELSTTSENPVQNKVITQTLNESTVDMKIIDTEWNVYEFYSSAEYLSKHNENQMDQEEYERFCYITNLIYQATGNFHTSLVEFYKEGFANMFVTCFVDPEEQVLRFSWNTRNPDDEYISLINIAYRFNDDCTAIFPVHSNSSDNTEIISETKDIIKQVFNTWYEVPVINSMQNANRQDLLNGMFRFPITESTLNDLAEGKYLGINVRLYDPHLGSESKWRKFVFVGGKSELTNNEWHYTASFEFMDFSENDPEKLIFNFVYGNDGECSCGVKTIKFINDDNIINN